MAPWTAGIVVIVFTRSEPDCACPRSAALYRALLRSAALARAQLRSTALYCTQPRLPARSAVLGCAQPRSLAPSHALARFLSTAHFAVFLRTCALCCTLRALGLPLSPRTALTRGLSNSSATRSRLERPPIPRFTPRRSVCDRFRPLATAQLRSPFPTSPHLRAAFTLQHQRARNCRGPAYKVSRRADACATVCDHSQLTDLAPLPNLAALVRGTIPSTATRLRPPRTYIRRLAPRGGLRDRLRRFTPPNPAQP
ncbi:hypothetical protein EDB85DRAFT_2149579 [Lactarius pseudohatsudake]|nr:hypothetical protein EDB85DRAFT_2149579 [Lactarius pseudohatsudake]